MIVKKLNYVSLFILRFDAHKLLVYMQFCVLACSLHSTSEQNDITAVRVKECFMQSGSYINRRAAFCDMLR